MSRLNADYIGRLMTVEGTEVQAVVQVPRRVELEVKQAGLPELGSGSRNLRRDAEQRLAWVFCYWGRRTSCSTASNTTKRYPGRSARTRTRFRIRKLVRSLASSATVATLPAGEGLMLNRLLANLNDRLSNAGLL